MPRPRPIAQLDFSGGENLVVNPYLIAQKQVAEAENLVLDEHGSLRTRDGLVLLTTSPITSQPIRYRGSLTLTAGTTYPFAIQRTSSGPNRLYTTTSWSQIGSDFTTDEPLPWAVPVLNQMVILNGYETPIAFDGTSWSRITAQSGQTVPPGAKHGSFHLGSLWLWNTNASTTTLDGPSSLRACDPNDISQWPNANQTFISKDDGQVGMGLTAFTIVETGISPTATLVLFKNYSGYQVTGVFGGDTFSVQQIKSDMGCIAPRTIQFVSGFGVIRLTHKGFSLYNGVEDRLISEEERPAIFGGRGITGLDFANIDRAWAVQSQNPPLYIAACPVAGTSLTRLFAYDLIRRGWTRFTLPVPIASMNLYFAPGVFPTIHVGGASDGKIYRFFAGDRQDDGVDIAWSVKTRAYFTVNQMEPTFWRRAQINLEGEPNQTITVTPYVDGEARAEQPFTIPNSDEDDVETVLSPDIMEVGNRAQLFVAGSGRAALRGIELQAVPKPINKYKRFA